MRSQNRLFIYKSFKSRVKSIFSRGPYIIKRHLHYKQVPFYYISLLPYHSYPHSDLHQKSLPHSLQCHSLKRLVPKNPQIAVFKTFEVVVIFLVLVEWQYGHSTIELAKKLWLKIIYHLYLQFLH